MPLKAPIAFFDNSLSYGSSVDEELIELTANYENENEDDTDDNIDIIEEDDNNVRDIMEERKRQKRNCKIYRVSFLSIKVILKELLLLDPCSFCNINGI